MGVVHACQFSLFKGLNCLILITISMETIRRIFQNRWLLFFVVILGLAVRMAFATLGSNYDMRSWFIVADITSHGGNVYAETDRYNYGPVWFMVIHLLDLISGGHHEVLRYLIAGVLSLADLGIFFFLIRFSGPVPAVIFLLNPVSIIITGYHCQFDNVAVLLGLWSVFLLGDNFETPVNRRKFLGLLVLGLSLVTKHIFFVFPVWLAVKQKGFWQKTVVVVVPAACFLLSFAPYWGHARQGIMDNVFSYHSNSSNLFYQYFVPKLAQDCFGSNTVWYGLLALFAFFCRTKSAFESLLIYTGVLVAFSPATSNQYLAIPAALAAVFMNVPFGLYFLVATYHLCADVNGPHFVRFGCYNDLAVIVLCFALSWLFWRNQYLQFFKSIHEEIGFQLGRMK